MLEHHHHLFMPILNYGIQNRTDYNNMTQFFKNSGPTENSLQYFTQSQFFVLLVFFFLVSLFGNQKTCLLIPVWTSYQINVPPGKRYKEVK